MGVFAYVIRPMINTRQSGTTTKATLSCQSDDVIDRPKARKNGNTSRMIWDVWDGEKNCIKVSLWSKFGII